MTCKNFLIKVADKSFKIKQKEDEPDKEYFLRVKEIFLGVKEKRKDAELISGTIAFPPKQGIKIYGGQLYCPYCRKSKVFVDDIYLGVKKCVTCNMSDSDFYVKLYNGIFGKEFADSAMKK